MPDELELARGWFLKAESDLNTAKRMSRPATTLQTALESEKMASRHSTVDTAQQPAWCMLQ
ncbi:MAG: hypothetical protein ACRD3T_11615 [Terriglobia bacterium]